MPKAFKNREWLIELRLRKKKERADVAKDLGISKDMVRKIECGERTPRHDLAVRMADYYGFSWTRFHEG